MKAYREYTTWAETAEYLAGQIKEKTKTLQLKPPDEARVSFSPAFLTAYVWSMDVSHLLISTYQILTQYSLDQVNAALGTNLTQEKYDDRIRILRETEAFARESCVKSTAVSNGSPVASLNVDVNSHLVRSTSTTPFRPANTSTQDRDGSTTHRATKRQRTDQEVDELCHGNSGGISATQAGSPLDVLADVTLPNGSRLPITNLEGQSPNNPGIAAGMEGTGIDTDAQGEPSGISLGTIVSPGCRNSPAESLDPLRMLLDAAGQAERLDQEIRNSAQEEAVDLLMREYLYLDSESE
jgi:hypothetical protein